MVKKAGKAGKNCRNTPQNAQRVEINRNCINFDIKKEWLQLFSGKFSCLKKSKKFMRIVHKICQFYAEIVKFDLISIHHFDTKQLFF